MDERMTTERTNSGPSDSQLLAMYERMLLVRRMEERLRDDNAAGKLPGAVHLYIGQEACGVGVCAHLDESDWITGTHRGHGHFLAKSGDPKAMMAEIWAKRTGICKGMGGSMHVTDLSKGILGANGIVGGGSRSPPARRSRRSSTARGASRCVSLATAPPIKACSWRR